MTPDETPATPPDTAANAAPTTASATPDAAGLDSMLPASAVPVGATSEAAYDALPVEPMVESSYPRDAAATTASPIALPELDGVAATAAGKHFGLLLDVGVEVAAVVGTRELKLEQVLAIQPGAIIDLDRHAGEPIELYVNGKPIALAEIVVVDGRLGARIVETLSARTRKP